MNRNLLSTRLALLLALLFAAGCRSADPTLIILPSDTPPPTATPPSTRTPDAFSALRSAMVQDQIEARGLTDPNVLAALRAVPRHRFVPEEYLGAAYEDHPLPIGFGQTISQPYIVALMTEVLQLSPGDRVLEIGTGSGYQAAVLAEMGAEVYTVEIIPELAQRAGKLFQELGYSDIQGLNDDGYYGWPDFGPFDAIIVTAAPDHVPQPLVQQLAEGSRMVIPIGPQGSFQTLWMFENLQGELTATNLGAVTFVPLTRAGASPNP
jgi:protein-L-isoaspartate(D-aspartate) O-methyltransferase